MTRLSILAIFMAVICSCNNVKKEDGLRDKKPSNDVHLCVDRLPLELPNVDSVKQAGGLDSKVWRGLSKNQSGQQIINVRFLEGSEFLKQKVIQYARQWQPMANVEFRFSDISSDSVSNPEIKIMFEKGNGSWSYLGTDSKFFSPSMNFGWFEESTSEEEFSRVILHEFGHALSLIHEHQNPRGNPIKWNKDEVYRYFSGSPNYWSRKQINENLFDKYTIDQINGSSFDENSIMLYSFPSILTLDGKGTKSNSSISELDKKTVRRLYN